MIHYKVGNWRITDEGIHWADESESKFFISKETLLEQCMVAGKNIYGSVLYLTECACKTKDDLLSLNITFMQAVQHHELRFDNSIFLATLSEQLKSIKSKTLIV